MNRFIELYLDFAPSSTSLKRSLCWFVLHKKSVFQTNWKALVRIWTFIAFGNLIVVETPVYVAKKGCPCVTAIGWPRGHFLFRSIDRFSRARLCCLLSLILTIFLAGSFKADFLWISEINMWVMIIQAGMGGGWANGKQILIQKKEAPCQI